ncbi:MAG: hypothetical protein ABIJ86_14170, partial [Spirochaetota bacterium]
MSVYKSIEASSSWSALLTRQAENLRETLTANRIQHRLVKIGGGLSYSYAAMDIDEPTIDLLASA